MMSLEIKLFFVFQDETRTMPSVMNYSNANFFPSKILLVRKALILADLTKVQSKNFINSFSKIKNPHPGLSTKSTIKINPSSSVL